MRVSPPLLALAAAALQAGCVTAHGPDAAARAYASALEQGRLEEAYAHVAEGSTSEEAFRARYATPAQQQARAAQVRAALGGLRAVGPGVEVVASGGGAWRLVEPAEGAAASAAVGASAAVTPEVALGRFLDAAAAGDFPAAYQLLAGPLRARYTPERLAADFRAEPEAASRLSRARAALGRPAERVGEAEAHFPLGPDRAVRLVHEAGGWRVAALE